MEISKLYSHSFHSISAKLYEDIGYQRGIQAVTFLGNLPSYKRFVTLCSFNMGVNGKIMKCAISWKRLTVEQKGWKFGTCGARNSICGVPFRSGYLSSVWGHSVRLNFQCDSNVIIKKLLLPQFSSIVQTLQVACSQGKYRL